MERWVMLLLEWGIRWGVVMEGSGQVRALFQFVVVQVEILGHLAPAVVVEVVVDASLVRACLLTCGSMPGPLVIHTRSSLCGTSSLGCSCGERNQNSELGPSHILLAYCHLVYTDFIWYPISSPELNPSPKLKSQPYSPSPNYNPNRKVVFSSGIWTICSPNPNPNPKAVFSPGKGTIREGCECRTNCTVQNSYFRLQKFAKHVWGFRSFVKLFAGCWKRSQEISIIKKNSSRSKNDSREQ